MSYFSYADLISSLLGWRIVDPGSTLIHIGANDPKYLMAKFHHNKIFNNYIPVMRFILSRLEQVVKILYNVIFTM